MWRMSWLMTASVLFSDTFAQNCVPQTALYKGGTEYRCFSQAYTRFPSNYWKTDTTKIDLHDNDISKIPSKSFKGLAALQYIGLYINQIKAIPKGVFDGLTSLQYLGLTSNRITAIPDRAFFGLTSLKQLLLFGNRISVIADDVFDGLTKLKEAPLYANRLNCSVSLPSKSLVCSSCSRGNLTSIDCDNISYFQCSSDCVFGALTLPTTISPTFSPTHSPTSPRFTTTTTPTTTTPPSSAHSSTTTTPSSSPPSSLSTITPNNLHTTEPPSRAPTPIGASTSKPAHTTPQPHTTTHAPAHTTTKSHTATQSSSECNHSGFPQHADVYTENICEILRNDDKCTTEDVRSNCNTTCCDASPHSLKKDNTTPTIPVWGLILLAVVSVMVVAGGTYVMRRQLCRQRNGDYTISQNSTTLTQESNTQSQQSNTQSHEHPITQPHAHTITQSHAHTLTQSHAHTLTQSHAHTTQCAEEQLEMDDVANYNEDMDESLLRQ